MQDGDSKKVSLEFLEGSEDLEGADQILIHVHEGAVVLELAAVVGSSEDSDQFPVPAELIAFLDHLMCSTDEVDAEILQEFGHYVFSEGVADSSLVFSPAFDVGVGVGPEEIAE